MKKLIIILAILTSGNVFGNVDTIRVKSKITDVTVFFNGAQITRHAEQKLSKGKFLILIDKLPQEINPQSIQVSRLNNCKILSVKHQLNYQSEDKKSSEELETESKIKTQELRIKEIQNKLRVFDLEEKLLLDNSILRKKEEGSAISEIKEAADFYRARLNEINQKKLLLFEELKAAEEKKQDFYIKLNELSNERRKTYSEILITLECEKEVSAGLSLSYYVSTAGWEPLYDFRVDDITKPLIIVYNANVYQSSGEDWNNVNIKLSTSNPSLSSKSPELTTWYLGRSPFYQHEPISKGASALKGRVLDAEANEALPFANVAVYQGNEMITGATTDFDGHYTIKPIQSGVYNVKASYIGYKPAQVNHIQLNPDIITFQDFNLHADAIAMQEVEVTEYKIPLISKDAVTSGTTITGEEIRKIPGRSGSTFASNVGGIYSRDRGIRGSQSAGNRYFIDGMKQEGIEISNYISNSLKTTVANLEYVIEIPYTIPSDGEDYNIKIKEASLPVDYVYHAVPKLDNDVFLIAKMHDWTELNLLSGKSSIYYQGTFTGESFIDADQTGDTLNISLGRDKSIIVKREGNKEMIDKRVIGSSIKETIGWDITIKNNKDTQIKITIEDQYPVSEKKSIEVEHLESSNAKVDEKTGKLTWELELAPNDKRTLNYKYSVKYPKYTNLTIE